MGEHIINRQAFDIKISKSLDAFEIQHRASEYYYQKILPALEKIFDELVVDDQIIEIDRMEIDLGFISSRHIGSNIFNEEHFRILKGGVSRELSRLGDKSKLKTLSVREQPLRQWLFYMEFGFLKWNTTQLNEGWYQSVLESLATNFASSAELRQLILKSKRARARMVNDHSTEFLVNLISVLAAKKIASIGVVVEELLNLIYERLAAEGRKYHSQTYIRQHIWEELFQLVAEEESIRNGGVWVEEQLIKLLLSNYGIRSMPSKFANRFPRIEAILEKVLNETNIPLGATAIESSEVSANTESLEKISAENEEEIKDQSVYVVSAGVILLHPFLTTFFNRLGLTKDNAFVDINQQQKAIQLLHYLATGNLEGKEYEMVISKLLCAYPIERPITQSQINELEKEESKNLLDVVVERWDKLGSTSVQALRESFLQRRGKISYQNDQLFLHVETNSLDVLLDFLPWSRSIVKLPWMKNMLRVEWR